MCFVIARPLHSSSHHLLDDDLFLDHQMHYALRRIFVVGSNLPYSLENRIQCFIHPLTHASPLEWNVSRVVLWGRIRRKLPFTIIIQHRHHHRHYYTNTIIVGNISFRISWTEEAVQGGLRCRKCCRWSARDCLVGWSSNK